MRKKITTFITSVLFVICMIGIMGVNDCDGNKANNLDAKQVETQQLHYGKGQPVPYFDFSLERDLYIKLYKARNQKVATHTVWRGDMSIVEGDCPSIGFPLPYDTSITNPLNIEWRSNGGAGVVEQAEPNGLFSSKNSIATWVRCVYDVEGEVIVAPIYVESTVTAYPFPVEVDYEKNRVYPMGKMPSVNIGE